MNLKWFPIDFEFWLGNVEIIHKVLFKVYLYREMLISIHSL